MNRGLMELLEPYIEKVNLSIKELGPKLGASSAVRDACEYSLLTPGKRFRPVLVLMMAEAIGSASDLTSAAIATECFHTASLIADDLPCMDNDTYRRNSLATHIKFGESTALLATYALIAAGYDLIATQSKGRPEVALEAIQTISQTTGLSGATGGQFFDLNPRNQSKEELERIIVLKTVSLFEMSFVLGWLFGGGDKRKLESVKKLAYHFGMAFQIADDIDDWDQDELNLAKLLGKADAEEAVQDHLRRFFNGLASLGIDSHLFKLLLESIVKKS